MEAPKTSQKRADIVAAAVLEFQERGFGSARIDRIAERAQVSKRTLYKHFGSKDGLFEAIVELVIDESKEVEISPYRPDEPLAKQLVEALASYVTAISTDEFIGLSRVMMAEFLRDQEVSRKVLERSELQNADFVALVKSAMDSGEIRTADPVYATNQLVSLAKASLYWPKLLLGAPLPEASEVNAVIEDSVAMFLNHYEAE